MDQPKPENLILVTREPNGIAYVTINRPRSLNSLTKSMMTDMARAFKSLDRDKSVRVVILSGSGRAFCSGVDLTAAEDVFKGDVKDVESDPVVQMELFRKPIIGAISGFAVTAGFEIALACDVLIAAKGAKFIDTHARFGIFPSWGLSQKLARIIGPNRAREASLTATPVTAEQGERWGLVNHVVEEGELMKKAQQVALAMIKNNQDLVLRYKSVINDGLKLDLGNALALEKERGHEYYKGMSKEQFKKMQEFIAGIEQSIKKEIFKNFDVVEDYSDHRYAKNKSENCFTNTESSQGTPYHDALFFFDIAFPSNYPTNPPQVFYRSHGLRLNPNLYANGYVCMSILNTWCGEGNEKWNPVKSTILQVLVSIQGLVLNAKPLYNEPGNSPASSWESYNEKVFTFSCKTMLFQLQIPPKNFESFVADHFQDRAFAILRASKAYRDGRVSIGMFSDNGPSSSSESNNIEVSRKFRDSMDKLIPQLSLKLSRDGTSLLDMLEKLDNEREQKIEEPNIGDNKKDLDSFLKPLEHLGWQRKREKEPCCVHDSSGFGFYPAIQGLVLNAKPYYNESLLKPACTWESYNEKVFVCMYVLILIFNDRMTTEQFKKMQEFIAGLKQIIKKENFKKFDVVEDYSDHHYDNFQNCFTDTGSCVYKKIMREWKILGNDLPDSIFVRVYGKRINLLRAVIIGAQGTPYHDSLFFFDIVFPSNYPTNPLQREFLNPGSNTKQSFNLFQRTVMASGLEQSIKKENFENFDLVEDYADHHYAGNKRQNCFTDTGSCVYKAIMREWKILGNDLPDSIFVRVYEKRLDLLRAVIIGARGTPYHDALFFFDIAFPSNYPVKPPQVFYMSHGLRLNPNLYKNGHVCLSILNTWHGKGNEKWNPAKSTILQVLVSIQGLVLNAKPYCNEPGSGNSPASYWESYNEKDRAFTILRASKAYRDGRVSIGLFSDNGPSSSSESNNIEVSRKFGDSMDKLIPQLSLKLSRDGTSLQDMLEKLDTEREQKIEEPNIGDNKKDLDSFLKVWGIIGLCLFVSTFFSFF
ncbi:hypothetical protein EZV62_000157 [Acer yangbiense]|uniref:UBC core domain-containing protein n=1 Tax=Acer yangbiense TaxID=1000413 RepID=A0A5C7IR54_9ROSI|nr:hypothetical protein EZV62_000157 [Acer yangbiense]